MKALLSNTTALFLEVRDLCVAYLSLYIIYRLRLYEKTNVISCHRDI